MVADAERNRAEDARLREEVDARNELDAVAYQVERRLDELGDAVPSHEKARAEMLVADARQAVKEEAPLDRVRALIVASCSRSTTGSEPTGVGAGDRCRPAVRVVRRRRRGRRRHRRRLHGRAEAVVTDRPSHRAAPQRRPRCRGTVRHR